MNAGYVAERLKEIILSMLISVGIAKKECVKMGVASNEELIVLLSIGITFLSVGILFGMSFSPPPVYFLNFTSISEIKENNVVSTCCESMKPTIHLGDVVQQESVNASDVELGDIVIYTKPTNSNESVRHRVVGIHEEDFLIIKGDNNEFVDCYYSSCLINRSLVIKRVTGIKFKSIQ